MAQFERAYATRTAATQVAYDQGLRQYMLRIYNYMASGLFLTGAVAVLMYQSGFVYSMIGSPLMWVVVLSPLAISLVLSFGYERMSSGTIQALFWTYAVLFGLSLSTIFIVYTAASIARVFFITAGMFAGVSLWAYTTKADLSRFSSFLFMGMWGIVLAGLVNIFVQSSALQFALSVLSVILFTGLTAWNTQFLKEMYDETMDRELVSKISILGALNLYTSFLGLFMNLLQLLGVVRGQD